MNSLIVFQQMLVLFAMILVGYFCYKKDIITDERKRSIACTFTCNGLLLQPG